MKFLVAFSDKHAELIRRMAKYAGVRKIIFVMPFFKDAYVVYDKHLSIGLN